MLKKNSVMLTDEAIVGIHLTDRISVPTRRTINDQGQMLVPCKFARTGTQLYTAKQLGLVDEDPDKIVTVHRDEQDVFQQDSMDSFRSAPVTIGHPKDDKGMPIKVTSVNSKELQVGALEGMPVRDNDTLGGTLVITAQEAIDNLDNGMQELSAGYICDIEEVDGKLYQRNIRANHIAIVSKGRAGSSCRISDEALDIQEENAPVLIDEALLTDALEQLEVQKKLVITIQATVEDTKAALELQKKLTIDFKADSEKNELELESVKVELVDARLAAKEGVIERCEVIEHARLIADMRDLGDKSVSEIRKLVVEDQYPSKNLTGKSDSFIEAMFEMLVDQAKGETPMSKILAQQVTHVVADGSYVDPVLDSRTRMVKRQSKLNK